MNTLNVEYRKVEALIPYARNPRTHAESQIAKIAASIVEYGWTNPILVDGDNGIIAGHGRLAAARKLGLDQVPVIELAHLTVAQKRALVIADNRLALDAGWDEEMLALELADLSEAGYDLALTGFEDAEIEALLTGGVTDADADADARKRVCSRSDPGRKGGPTKPQPSTVAGHGTATRHEKTKAGAWPGARAKAPQGTRSSTESRGALEFTCITYRPKQSSKPPL